MVVDKEGEFDADELEFVVDDLTLLGGLVRYVVYPSYKDDEFDFESSSTEVEALCIVCADAKVIELKVSISTRQGDDFIKNHQGR